MPAAGRLAPDQFAEQHVPGDSRQIPAGFNHGRHAEDNGRERFGIAGNEPAVGDARREIACPAAVDRNFDALAGGLRHVLVTGAAAEARFDRQFVVGADIEEREIEPAVVADEGLEADFVVRAGRRLQVVAETAAGPGVEQFVQRRRLEAAGSAGVNVERRRQAVEHRQQRRRVVVADGAAVVLIAVGNVIVGDLVGRVAVAQTTGQASSRRSAIRPEHTGRNWSRYRPRRGAAPP